MLRVHELHVHVTLGPCTPILHQPERSGRSAVFIFSEVVGFYYHTRCQINAVQQSNSHSIPPPETHLEGAVESGDFGNLVLNHFCFDSKEGRWVGLIWVNLRRRQWGLFFPLWLRQFALLRNEWVSEGVASWPHCAGLLILLRRFKREACGQNKTQNTSRHNTPQQCAANWPDFFFLQPDFLCR